MRRVSREEKLPGPALGHAVQGDVDRDHRRTKLRRQGLTAAAEVGKWPESVAYDAERRLIYTTGILGQLVVLRPNADATAFAAETTRLHVGAHTLAIDPETHRLYVAYASLLIGPRLAVFSPATGGTTPEASE